MGSSKFKSPPDDSRHQLLGISPAGTSYSVTTPVLFADDNGVSGLNLVVTGLPAGLTATNNNNGTVTITGTPATSGTVTFIVAATDAGSGSANTSVSLTINAHVIPQPPANGVMPESW